MKNTNKYKTACILFDEEDWDEFNRHYQSELPDNFCWFPIDYIPMIQVVLGQDRRKYFLPKIESQKDCSLLTKEIYETSQDFLKKLFEHNKYLDDDSDHIQFFPSEYFWHCIFVGVYRIVSCCQNLLEQCPVDKIIIIQRDKSYNHGGLEANYSSYTSVIKQYFESKGVQVRLLPYSNGRSGTKRVFLYGKPGWKLKSLIKRTLIFFRWKYKSFRKENYKYLLIELLYDNKINYLPHFIYPKATMPQVFFERGIPFFHNFRNIVGFYKDKIKLDKIVIHPDYKKISYSFVIGDFQCDVANLFSTAIERYLNDIIRMKQSVDLWWKHCPRNEQLKTIIFTLPPVFMHSYFLIKKIIKNQGKVVTWQHGGFYGSADHFVQYITDYKLSDIFLSYGKSHAGDMGNLIEENCNKTFEIGTNYIFSNKDRKRRNNKKTLSPSNGLFIPAVIGTFYSQSRLKWDGPTQFQNIKKIIKILSSGKFGKVTIKGLKNHKPHLEIEKYIRKNNILNIHYTDFSLDIALSSNPEFVLLDAPSTPLIEILARYNGLVFVLNCQESWRVNTEALTLLKRRVFYSESTVQLEMQLEKNLLADTKSAIPEDNSFMDCYVKPFSYKKYQHFLSFLKVE